MRRYIRSLKPGIIILIILSLMTIPVMADTSPPPIPGEMGVAVESRAIEGSGMELSSEALPEFTKLQIDPRHSHNRLQPGESKTIEATLKNLEDEAVIAAPKLVILPFSENYIEEAWISITPAEKEIEAGAKETFEIKISIPEDADLGHYSGHYSVQIAFTEDSLDSYALYPNYINSMNLNLEVWTPPKVRIMTPYIEDRIEAGKEYDYEIKIENVGDIDIPLDPKFDENEVIYECSPYMNEQAFGSDAITINAPKEVKAGETAIVKMHLKVPEDAKGRYNSRLDLNLEDPSIREYEGGVSLGFEIWKQPTEPYVKPFEVEAEGPITIEIHSDQYDRRYRGFSSTQENKDPAFELTLTGPTGAVTPVLTGREYGGRVDMGANYYPPWEMDSAGIYRDTMKTYIETYTVPGEAAMGDWELGIMPYNTERFQYRISIGSKASE